MKSYLDLLQELLKEIELNRNVLYLSLYFPYSNRDAGAISNNNEFKSLISDYLDSQEILSDKHALKHEIVTQVSNESKNFDFHKAGYGVFVTIDLDTKELKIWGINLLISPVEEIYLGDCFDFDQLFPSINRSKATIILDLKEKESRLFSLKDSELKQILFQSNTFLSSTDEDSQAVMDQSSGKPGKVGSIANNGEKLDWITEENKHYLQALQDCIHNLEESFDYLLIFYSSKFGHLLPELNSHFVNDYNLRDKQVILEEKNLKTDDQIAQEARQIITQLEETQLTKLYSDNTKDYQHYTSGWNQTLTAINEGRVEILFIKPKLYMQGYMDEMKNLFLEPFDNSTPVSNITPWMLKKVVDLGGSVRVLYDSTDLEAVDISAKLRY